MAIASSAVPAAITHVDARTESEFTASYRFLTDCPLAREKGHELYEARLPKESSSGGLACVLSGKWHSQMTEGAFAAPSVEVAERMCEGLAGMAATGMAAAATAVAGKRVLTTRLMGCVADMALSVASFIALEVVEGTRSATGDWTVVAVAGVKAIVHVAIKAMRAVEPGASAEEHAADEPVGAVVTVRSAIVRSVVEVAIRANGGYSNADGDLSGSRANRSSAEKGDRQS